MFLLGFKTPTTQMLNGYITHKCGRPAIRTGNQGAANEEP